jgi:hypothetical protein
MLSAALLAVLSLSSATAASPAAPRRRAVFFEGGSNTRGRWELADDAFAARELSRYIYLSTGTLPAVIDAVEHPGVLAAHLASSSAARPSEAIVLASPDSALLRAAAALAQAEDERRVSVAAARMDHRAEVGHHTIYTLQTGGGGGGGALTLIVGAGEFGRLYGSYSAASQLGVRFELTGDVLPDPTQAGGLPLASPAAAAAPLPFRERDFSAPMFDFRGLQPFHDFPCVHERCLLRQVPASCLPVRDGRRSDAVAPCRVGKAPTGGTRSTTSSS